MKLAYICTNYNNTNYTALAVRSLLRNPEHDVRVYVVDNASHQNERDELHNLAATMHGAVEIIDSPVNVGYFAGLNIGIKAARQGDDGVDWMIIGNNDLEFPADFCDCLERQRGVYCQYAVIAPDIVTRDGEHQNPHVISSISKLREIFYDFYYANYYLGSLIYKAAKIFPRLTRRGDEREWRNARPIYQGHGSCYLLTPRFFSRFDGLWAPTFLMCEEFFLSLQLSNAGERVYYSPEISVVHQWHGSLQAMPSRQRWSIARNAHRQYRKYVKVF